MAIYETVRKMTSEQQRDITAIVVGAIPNDLSFDEAQAIIGSKGPIVAEIRDVFNRRRSNPGLLELIGTVVIPATTTPFVVREKFVIGTAGISWFSDQFRAWFLGETQGPAIEMTLRYSKLMKFSVDGPILVELGDKAETTLAQIFALLERQANGEEGALLINGWANIFYVNGRAVDVYRHDDGWRVYAGSVTGPSGWYWRDGDRVFSRNS